MKHLFALLLIFTLCAQSARASHIVGGEMYYEHLGGDQYRIYIAIYRDCASTGAPFDSPLPLGIYDANGNLYMTVNVPFPGSEVLPIEFDNPCITPPSGPCVERAIYTDVLTLPASAGGYTIAYQRCCRTPNVMNLDMPGEQGLTLISHIPGTGNSNNINGSPHFINYPPLIICNNEDLIFDHSAVDPDGDLLTYELVTPNAGATSTNPGPLVPPAPPYPLVDWASAYSATAPLGPGSTTTINPNTGLLFVDADLLGLYVVGIRVYEWRNGVVINSTTRDFIFKVVNCNISLSAVVTDQENTPGFVSICDGLDFTFDNQSFGASNYHWDFGIPGTTADTSNLFEPTVVFPSAGTYHVMLVANPGWPCTDTTYVDITVNESVNVDVDFQDSTCFTNNSIDFQSVVNAPPGVQLAWNFGPNASPQTSTAANVNNVNFNSPVGNSVKLVGTLGMCSDSVTYPIFFYDLPNVEFEFQDDHECVGLSQSFDNTTQSATPPSYHWDFGVQNSVADQSNVTDPSFTFPSPGTYTVTLVAQTAPGCADSVKHDIIIYDPLLVSFTHNDSLCIIGNSFNFVGNVTGPPNPTYLWNFGPNATPSTATTLNVNNVVYNTGGAHTMTLTANFMNCSETASSSVYIFNSPTINFSVLDSVGCEPFKVFFTDHSTADSEILYFWDFGDGQQSNDQNPTHTYTSVGQYTVNLTIETTEGCIDTLSMTKLGLITVHPNPVADFSIDKNYTDICNSAIKFTNHSQGGHSYTYVFDDITGATSSEENPTYSYAGDGFHTPYLVVTNEFGCQDISRESLFIEPFTPYIPNTFTPDGDEFNNQFKAVLALEPVEWDMKIFNRWGQLVFHTNDYLNDFWDGTFEGLAAQEGTYIYVVEYIPCGVLQDKERLTGHVSLLR